jgi:hypothetical protein
VSARRRLLRAPSPGRTEGLSSRHLAATPNDQGAKGREPDGLQRRARRPGRRKRLGEERAEGQSVHPVACGNYTAIRWAFRDDQVPRGALTSFARIVDLSLQEKSLMFDAWWWVATAPSKDVTLWCSLLRSQQRRALTCRSSVFSRPRLFRCRLRSAARRCAPRWSWRCGASEIRSPRCACGARGRPVGAASAAPLRSAPARRSRSARHLTGVRSMDMLVSGGGAARSCTTLRSRSRSRSRHMGFTSKRSSYAGSASVSTQGPRPKLRLAWRPSWRAQRKQCSRSAPWSKTCFPCSTRADGWPWRIGPATKWGRVSVSPLRPKQRRQPRYEQGRQYA